VTLRASSGPARQANNQGLSWRKSHFHGRSFSQSTDAAFASNEACSASHRAPPQTKSPGLSPGPFLQRQGWRDHAAGLNSFDALVLIGSTVSAATFCDSSASSLL
jgi:hypothetical protein